MSKLEAPDLTLLGSSESPSLMTKQLAFQQRFVEHGTVDDHERARARRIGRVQRLGDKLLAGSGFPVDQDRRAQRCDLFDQIKNPANLGALRHHVVKWIIAAHLLAQTVQLVHELAPLEHTLHQPAQPIGIIWLRDEIVRAGLHRS